MEESCVLEESHEFQDSIFHIGSPGDMDQGIAIARKLSKDWLASTLVQDLDSVMNIGFSTYPIPQVTHLTELFVVFSLPKEVGCYSLKSDRTEPNYAWYSLIELDISIGRWTLYEEDGIVNKLAISRITEDSVFGEFSASFLDTGRIPWLEADYIRFYNGTFEARLSE